MEPGSIRFNDFIDQSPLILANNDSITFDNPQDSFCPVSFELEDLTIPKKKTRKRLNPLRMFRKKDVGANEEAEKTEESALPSNLILPRGLKERGRVLTALGEGLFVAGSMLYLGGCAAAAVIPNAYNKKTKNTFSKEQVGEIKKHLKPGDIILTKSKIHQTFYYLLHSTYGHDYSHAATYIGNDEIIDSYDQPDRQNIFKFFGKMTDIAVLRPKYDSQEQVSRQIEYLEAQLGKPYDMRFDTLEEEKHYCSELTLRGLEASGVDIKVPGHSVLGHPFVLPDDFRNAEGIKTIKTFSAKE